MQADFKIVIDACVLANIAVCDLLLRLAEKPRLLIPKWSREIMSPEIVVQKLNDIARKRNKEMVDLLLMLGKALPNFSSHLISDLGLET